MKKIFLIVCMLFPSILFAEIYQQSNSSGGITYSDTPHASSETVTMSAPNAYSTTNTQVNTSVSTTTTNSTPLTTAPLSPALNPTAVYTHFAIVDPADQYTFTNQPEFLFTVVVDPQLREGDSVQLLIDNVPQGSPQTALTFRIVNIDRGAHIISALLLDKNGAILMSAPSITVYVQHATVRQVQQGNRAP